MIDAVNGTPFTVQFVLSKIGDSRCTTQNLLGIDVEDITHGSAFMSHIFKLVLHWKDKTIMPHSLILKVPGVANSSSFQESAAGENKKKAIDTEQAEIFLQKAHGIEMHFYSSFPQYDSQLKLPKYYYGYEFRKTHNKGLIIMEDLTLNGCTVPMLPGLTDDQMCAVIDELARFNAAAWKNDDWRCEMTSPKWNKDVDQFVEGLRLMGRRLQQLKPELFQEVVDSILPYFTVESMKACAYVERKYGFPSCGVHGDLWSPNILWKKDENDQATAELLAVIDWQLAHEGNPLEDFGRLFSLNVSSEYRKKNTKRLLKRYYDRLTELFSGNPPCTFEQVLDAYRGAAMYVAMFTVFGTPMYYRMPSVVGAEGDPKREQRRAELLERVHSFCEFTASVMRGEAAVE